MTFKMMNKDRTMTVFHYSHDTCEFVGTGDALIPADTGLPAFCTAITPPEEKESHVRVYDPVKSKWTYQLDKRGTYYDKATGFPVYVSGLGDVLETLTALMPGSTFDKWDGEKWIQDEVALRAYEVELATQEKVALLSHADKRIAIFEDAIRLKMATENEIKSLEEWQKCRVLLNRVDLSDAPSITWPVVPEDVA